MDSPDEIKTLICTYQCKESFKELLADAYDYYVAFKGLSCLESVNRVEFNSSNKMLVKNLKAKTNQPKFAYIATCNAIVPASANS